MDYSSTPTRRVALGHLDSNRPLVSPVNNFRSPLKKVVNSSVLSPVRQQLEVSRKIRTPPVLERKLDYVFPEVDENDKRQMFINQSAMIEEQEDMRYNTTDDDDDHKVCKHLLPYQIYELCELYSLFSLVLAKASGSFIQPVSHIQLQSQRVTKHYNIQCRSRLASSYSRGLYTTEHSIYLAYISIHIATPVIRERHENCRRIARSTTFSHVQSAHKSNAYAA